MLQIFQSHSLAFALHLTIGSIFLALGGSVVVTAIAFALLVWIEQRQSGSK